MNNPCDYENNWAFSQKSMPEVIKILIDHAKYFIDFMPASEEEDMKHATDYVIKFKGGKIAIRVRRSHYKYRDLTIRTYSNGHKTEIHKILEGFADYYFYGWIDGVGKIDEYLLVDLDKLRGSGLLKEWEKYSKRNRDGRTGFLPISPFALITCDVLIDYNLQQNYLWGSP